MFKKLNLKTLLIVLAVVAGLYLVSRQWGDNNRSFRDVITDFNPEKVTSFSYTKRGGEEVSLKRAEGKWVVSQGGKDYKSDSARVAAMLRQISSLKTKQLAAMNKDKWEEYQVTDSAGTFVEVRGADGLLSSLYIGKFSYKQPDKAQQTPMRQPQGEMTTYVRVNGEKEVYAVDGFLSMAFPSDINRLRDKTLIDFTKSQARQITVAGKDNYTLKKGPRKWMINGQQADSAKMVSYLNTLTRFNGKQFAERENVNKEDGWKLTIQLEDGSVIELNAYLKESDSDKASYLVTSTQNEKAVFIMEKTAIDRLFKKQSYFR